MAELTITNDDIAALASKLDALADRFDAQERAALHAVFHLAGAAMCDAAMEVAGHGVRTGPGPAGTFAIRGDAEAAGDALGTSFERGLQHGPPTAIAAHGALTIELSR